MAIKEKYKNKLGDIMALLKIYKDWDSNGQNRKWCEKNYINHTLMKRTRKYVKELNRVKINYGRISDKYAFNQKGTGIDVVPDFKNFRDKNNRVFENIMRLPAAGNSLNERILMSFYIGFIPFICFRNKKGGNFISCCSLENKPIMLNNKSFVEKKAVSSKVVATEIFWSNKEAPLKINMFCPVLKSLEENVNKIMKALEIQCTTKKIVLESDKSGFKPNYKRL